jgi:hypothetical protein
VYESHDDGWEGETEGMTAIKEEGEKLGPYLRGGAAWHHIESGDRESHSADFDGRKEAALGREWPVMGWFYFLVGRLGSKFTGS